MLDALQQIELMSLGLSYEVMIGLGAAILGLGLCVWLGGLRWMLLSGVLSGCFSGFVCASLVPVQFQVKAFAIAAIVFALFVVILRKRSLVFVAAMVIVYSSLFLSALPSMNESSDWHLPEIPQMPQGEEVVESEGAQVIQVPEKLSHAESFSVLKDQSFFLCNMIGNHIKKLPGSSFIFTGVAGFVVIGVGMFFARIVSCVGSSMVGTLYMFTGMIVLLLQKGAMPFSGINTKPIFYQTIIICMIIFGSVCCFLLCPIRRVKPAREIKTDGEK